MNHIFGWIVYYACVMMCLGYIIRHKIESVLGIDLPDDQIKALIEGVKAKVSLDQAGGLLGSIKKLF